MTLAATIPFIEYIGNGMGAAMAVPFRFFDDQDLMIHITDNNGAIRQLLLVQDYNVTGAGQPAGQITLTTPLKIGETLQIERVTPRRQDTHYSDGNNFPAEAHEKGLDRGMAIQQEQDVLIANTRQRALMVDDGETALPVGDLANGNGKALGIVNNAIVPVANDAIAIAQNVYDAQTAANVAEQAAAAAAAERQASETAADNSSASAGQAQASTAAAFTHATAALSASVASGVYETQAAGIAAVADGVNFWVPAADGLSLNLFKRVGAGAVSQNVSVTTQAAYQEFLNDTAAAATAAKNAVGAAMDAVIEAGVMVSTSLAGLEINNNPVIIAPKDVTVRSSAGRLARGPNGFYIIEDGDTRVVRNPDSSLAGLYFEGAETIHGANWHEPNAGTGDANHLSSTSNLGIFRYADTHATPDIFGTTSKCIEYEKTTTSGTMNIFQTNNRQTLAIGDIMRCLITFSHAPFVGTAYQLRFAPARATSSTGFGQSATCNVQPDGSITNIAIAGTITGKPIIGSIDEIATLANGEKVYTAWIDGRATAAFVDGVPQLTMTTTQTELKLHIHAISRVINPLLQRPSAIPVFEHKLFADDLTSVGGGDGLPYEVEFHDLAVGWTKALGDNITVPTFYSSCAIPLETRLEIRESFQLTNKAFKNPSRHFETGARSFGAGATNHQIWGAGRYDFVLQLDNAPVPAGQMAEYIIEGAWDEPERWPLVNNLIASNGVTVKVTAKNAVAFNPATVGNTIQEINQSTEIWRISCRDFDMDNCRIRGHNLWHSRSWPEAEFSPAVDGDRLNAQYFGTFNITASLPNGFNHSIRNTELSHLLTGPSWGVAASGTNTGTVVYEGNYSHDMVVDHYNTGGGTVNHTIRNSIMAASTNYAATIYQSEREIEVDVGNGRVPISASGVTLASLKRLQRYEHFGFRATSFGDIVPAPNRNLSIIPTSLALPVIQTVTSKPGFEFATATPFDKSFGGAQRHTDLQVYCNVGDGSEASPTNPHVYLTVQLGRWDGAVYTPGANPVLDSVRLHTDCIQINGQPDVGGNLTMLVEDCLLISSGQTMLFGGTSSTPAAVDLADLHVRNTIAISGGFDAASIYLLDTTIPARFTQVSLFPTAQPYVANTFGWFRARGVDTQMTLTNCVVTVNNVVGSSNYTSLLATEDAVITGQPLLVAADWRDGAGNITLGSTRDIPQMRDFIDDKWLDDLGHVKVTVEAELRMTFMPYAHAITGIPYNDILRKARSGGWTRYGKLNALLDKFDRKPDVFLTVPRATPVGTVLLTNMSGNHFDRLYGGDTSGFFDFTNGVLRVASVLTRGLPVAPGGKMFLLITDQDQHILVDVT